MRVYCHAMVNLTLRRLCGNDVTVHHAGLLFNQVTDASGRPDNTDTRVVAGHVARHVPEAGDGAVMAPGSTSWLILTCVAFLQWKGITGISA
jgi:hypothetical protein